MTAAPGDERGLRATPLGVLAVAVPVVAWSFANLTVKVTRLDAVAFAFWRLVLACVLMLGVLVATRRPLRRAVVVASIPGGVLFGLNLIFFFSAIKHTGVADVLVIGALQPGLTLLVAGRLFGERVGRSDVALVAGSMAAVAVFVVGSSAQPVWSLEGDLYAVASLAAFTGYFLVSKRVRERAPATEYLTTVTLVATVVVTPVALLSGQSLAVTRAADWGWLVVFTVAVQVGHLMLVWAHRHVDVTVSSLLILGEPPISAAAAWALLGEPLNAVQVLAGLAGLACLGVVIRRVTRRRDDVLAEPVAA